MGVNAWKKNKNKNKNKKVWGTEKKRVGKWRVGGRATLNPALVLSQKPQPARGLYCQNLSV